MIQLRKKMLEELRRRNYAHRPAQTYIRIVRDFAAHFHRSPDKLGPEHIRHLMGRVSKAIIHSTNYCTRLRSIIQFVSQVLPPSVDSACSQ